MSNLLQYNSVENSDSSRKNCNSPTISERQINNPGEYFFMPVHTSGSESGSERSPITRSWLDRVYMRFFFNFGKNSVVLAFMLIYISVYLGSQVLQISSLISSDSHNVITSSKI